MAPRLRVAVVSIVGAAVIGALSTIAATDSTSVAGTVGRSGWVIPGFLSAAGLAVLVAALSFAGPRAIGPALALFGAAWLMGVQGAGGLRPFTPVAGGWLLAVGEFAYWSLDLKLAGRDLRVVTMRRGATIALLVGASTAFAAVPEFGFAPAPVAGVALTAAGLLGAAVLVAVAAVLAWRLRPQADTR